MSLIASFTLLPRDRVAGLIECLTPREPKRRFFLLKEKAPPPGAVFHEYLEAHGREQADYEYSGVGFSTLELLLDPKGIRLFDGGVLDAESQQMSRRLKTSMVLFDHARAQELRRQLDAAPPTESDIAKFLQEEFGEVEPEHVQAVLAAYHQAREWFAGVDEASVGLLIVG